MATFVYLVPNWVVCTDLLTSSYCDNLISGDISPVVTASNNDVLLYANSLMYIERRMSEMGFSELFLYISLYQE